MFSAMTSFEVWGLGVVGMVAVLLMVLVPRFGMVRLWLLSQTRLGPGPRQQGRQVQAVGSLPARSGSEWRAERSGGLHKRSAEDEGAACARQGRSPSGGLVALLGAERRRSIRFCS